MLAGTLPREIGGPASSGSATRMLPKQVLAVLRRGLASDPEMRYPDMSGFVADVASLRRAFRPSVRRHAIAAAVTCAVLIAAVFAWRIEHAKPAVSSLLVMPFHSLSSDPDQTHLEAGLADAVITRLAGFSQLRVPPFAAVKPAEDPFEAARRLGVDTVLTGTVDREGAELRVTAQLARTADRTQIWASRFDELFTDILTVEDTIAGRIASNLLTDMPSKGRETLKHRETENVQAYDLYLRAREQWARRTPESIRVAIRMYQDAIALDPRFSLAYAGLADCYNLTVSGLEPSVRFPLARTAVMQAIALDPQSAAAHTANAFMLYKFEWKWKEAEREFRLAIQLDPSYVQAHHWFGEFLKLLMRHDESIAEFRKAIDLDPFSMPVRYDYILALLNAGRVTDAAKEVSDDLAIDPMAGRLFTVQADILELQGRLAESADARLHSYDLGGRSEAEVAAQRKAFRVGGLAAMKRKNFEQVYAQTSPQKTPGAASTLALGYAEGRNRAATLHWLQIAADRIEDAPLLMKTHIFDFVRDDPQFQQLLHRVGLDVH
jgi:TolB-like protein